MDGVTFSLLVRNVWMPTLIKAVFKNNWIFNQKLFPIVKAKGGRSIDEAIQVTITTDVGTFEFDDVMGDPFTTTEVKASFNKKHYQETARLFKMYQDYMAEGGTEIQSLDAVKEVLATGLDNLIDKMTETMITDMINQIDDSAAYSDAALSRSTYPTLRSYVDSDAEALSLPDLDGAISALRARTTWGAGVKDPQRDLAILVPAVLQEKIASLVGSAAQMTYSAQSKEQIDGGQILWTTHYGNLPVEIVPGMTSTTLLVVHKPDIKIFETKKPTWTPKSELAYTDLWHGVASYNIVVSNPNNHAKLTGKLTGKTA